jgi:hypothetical protein
MKRIIFILLSITLSNYSFSQEPYPFFAIDYIRLSSSMENLLTDYTLQSYTYEDFEFYNKVELIKLDESRFWKTDNYVNIPIYGRRPKKSNLFLLKIISKNNNKSVNLFIRTSYNIGFGEFVKVTNISFISGNYFFDMCNSKKKFKINGKRDSTIIDCEKLKKHSISLRKLKRLIKKYDCK